MQRNWHGNFLSFTFKVIKIIYSFDTNLGKICHMKPELAYFLYAVRFPVSTWLSCKHKVFMLIYQSSVCLQDLTVINRAWLALLHYWQWNAHIVTVGHRNTIYMGYKLRAQFMLRPFSFLYAISVTCHRFLTCLCLKTSTTEKYCTTKMGPISKLYPPIHYCHSYSIMKLSIKGSVS